MTTTARFASIIAAAAFALPVAAQPVHSLQPNDMHDWRRPAPAAVQQQHPPISHSALPPHSVRQQRTHMHHPPSHRWRTGQRLPSSYRNRHYVVNDWNAHRLPPPPRGQHWVQVDGGYARIVIATGIIMQLIGL